MSLQLPRVLYQSIITCNGKSLRFQILGQRVHNLSLTFNFQTRHQKAKTLMKATLDSETGKAVRSAGYIQMSKLPA
jgi:hypothetical protein